MNTKFEEKSEQAKANNYQNIIEDLIISNPGQWYSKFKRMASHGQQREEIANLWKLETVTPVPKVYSRLSLKHLRKISVFINFSKISELIVSDMKEKWEKTQFGNLKGTGVQQYLVKMIHKILCILDNNSKGEIIAVIANLYDWRQAFNLQCPKLVLDSFIQNGVSASLTKKLFPE